MAACCSRGGGALGVLLVHRAHLQQMCMHHERGWMGAGVSADWA